MSNLSKLQGKKSRRDAVVQFSILELLVMMVFVLLVFTNYASDVGEEQRTAIVKQLDYERRRNIELSSKAAQFQTELEATRRRESDLQAQIEDKERFINRVLAHFGVTLSEARGRFDVPRSGVGRGGVGYPKCVDPIGFLFVITLQESGDLNTKFGPYAETSAIVAAVPQVMFLVNAGPVSMTAFEARAKLIRDWGESQDVPCRFHVDVFPHEGNISTFRKQMALIDKYFYPKRR